MLLVPYSSTAWITLRRMPVRMEETTTTTSTPITTPNTVSPLRIRWARRLSNAMRRVSRARPERGRAHQLRVRATTGSSFAARDAG